MKKIVITLLLAQALTQAHVLAAPVLTEEDKDFVRKASQGSLMEVGLGKLAVKNGSDATVKTFGKQMINEHGKAENEIKALAAKKSVQIAAKLEGDEKNHETEMQKLNGKQFDQRYAALMLDDHIKDVKMFQDKANSTGGDAEVRDWAKKTVKTLEHHLQMAKDMNSKMNGSSN